MQPTEQSHFQEPEHHLDQIPENTNISEDVSPSAPTDSNIVDSLRKTPQHPHHEHAPHHGRPRRGSSVSHVDVDFFDRPGFNQLQRTLTEISRHRREQHKGDSESSTDSDVTLALGDGPFDLERTARAIVIK